MPRHPLFRLTEWFTSPVRSDLLVLAIPFRALTGPIVLTSGISYRPPTRIFDGYLDPFQTASSTSPVWSSRRQVGPPSLQQGPQVMIATDNTAVVSVFPQQGGSIPAMSSCGLLFYGFNLTCYGQSVSQS